MKKQNKKWWLLAGLIGVVLYFQNKKSGLFWDNFNLFGTQTITDYGGLLYILIGGVVLIVIALLLKKK